MTFHDTSYRQGSLAIWLTIAETYDLTKMSDKVCRIYGAHIFGRSSSEAQQNKAASAIIGVSSETVRLWRSGASTPSGLTILPLFAHAAMILGGERELLMALIGEREGALLWERAA